MKTVTKSSILNYERKGPQGKISLKLEQKEITRTDGRAGKGPIKMGACVSSVSSASSIPHSTRKASILARRGIQRRLGHFAKKQGKVMPLLLKGNLKKTWVLLGGSKR